MTISGVLTAGYKFDIRVDFLERGKVKVTMTPVGLHYGGQWESYIVDNELLVETIHKGLKFLRRKISM